MAAACGRLRGPPREVTEPSLFFDSIIAPRAAWRSTGAKLAAPALEAYVWHPEEATRAGGARGDTAVGGGGEKGD